jgi:hypothetical protein
MDQRSARKAYRLVDTSRHRGQSSGTSRPDRSKKSTAIGAFFSQPSAGSLTQLPIWGMSATSVFLRPLGCPCPLKLQLRPWSRDVPRSCYLGQSHGRGLNNHTKSHLALMAPTNRYWDSSPRRTQCAKANWRRLASRTSGTIDLPR